MSKKILICDSCKRQFKTEQGYGRHIETYPDHEICFNNQNNTSTTFCSDSNEINNNNQTQKKIKSNDNKKIYKVDSHNNDKFQPTWNTYKIDSHLHPVHENIKDKDLSFIHNVIINSIQNQKLCNPQVFEDPTEQSFNFSYDQNDIYNPPEENIEYTTDNIDQQTFSSEDNINNMYSTNIFVDNFSNTHTLEELFSLELFKILLDTNSPHYVYNDIMSLVQKYVNKNFKTIPTTLLTRTNAIDYFSKRYNIHLLKPKLTHIQYKNKSFPVVKYNAESMIMSLLQDTTNLFNDENLLFPTIDGTPTGPIQNEYDFIGDLHTSQDYQQACIKLKQQANDLPIGIILYSDKITMDKHGHLSIDPLQFTLSIFNRKTRNKSIAWRPFGYIPNIGLHSTAESKHMFKAQDKSHLQHLIITEILKEYKQLEHNGISNYQFNYKNNQYTVNLKFFVLLILGDTEAHDKLCGHYNCRMSKVNNICRHCNIPTPLLDDPLAKYDLTKQSVIDQLVAEEKSIELKKLSQYEFHTAWKMLDITFGDNEYGIHGVTPSEPLHMIDLGIFKYLVQVFFLQLGSPDCKLHSLIDTWAKTIGRYLQHQSDRDLPRCYFPNGISGSTKLNGHEYIGTLLVIFMILKMEGSRQTIKDSNKNISDKILNQWASLLEICLCWRKWLQQETIDKQEAINSNRAHQELMKLILKYAERQEGLHWKIIKFHMITHISRNLIKFGVASNIDTSSPESNHKPNVKQPSLRTQKRASSIEIQTANRYYENLVIQYASQQLLPMLNKKEKQTNNHTMNGSKFYILSTTDEGTNAPVLHFDWITTESKITIHDQYLNWLGVHLLPKIGSDTPVYGFTEYYRDELIFRAHPNFRNKGGWFDWALFQWNTDQGLLDIPGQIIMFLKIPDMEFPISIDDRMTIEQEGLYALVESCSSPMNPLSKTNRIFDIKNKKAMITNRRGNQREEISDECLYLVHVDTINNPIAAIPNIGKEDEFEFIILRPCKDWYKGFTVYINESINK